MSRFQVLDTPIPELKAIQRGNLSDERGFLSRLFCVEELAGAGWKRQVAQINHTLTRRQGTVRGLHFQHPPYSEMKLVTCLRGAVWDVAVDLRAGSPTFLQWHAEELSLGNGRALLIPLGFAHGFQALTDDCELLYVHSAVHAPYAEGALNAIDPRLGICWPRPIVERSVRDEGTPMLNDNFGGIRL